MKDQQKIWHALYVASRQEKKVGELLETKGFEAYVPLVKTMRQWSDRKKMVELPLLNGYVFVHIHAAEQSQALQVRGVVNFVRVEGRIAIVKDSEIESLKQLISLGYQLKSDSANNRFNEGDRVKVVSSVLKGIEGYVIENKDGRHIELRLESIGQSIKVKLPEQILASVKNDGTF